MAIATLMNERVMLGALAKRAGAGVVRHAIAWGWSRRLDDPVRRDALARLWIESEILPHEPAAAERRERGTPGPEGSILKLAVGEYQQRLFSFIVNLLGPEGMLISDYEMRRPCDR